MAAPVRCFKHHLMNLHQCIGNDMASCIQTSQKKAWMDVFLSFMTENRKQAFNQAIALECTCNDDNDGSTETNQTLRLGSSWVSAPANDVALLHDVEDEDGFVFFCAGDDSSEPEWLENEEPTLYQRYINQE